MKGNKGQPIHIDSNLPGINYNIITNVMWYFDDVNEKNGTTIVVPGSHRFRKYAPGNVKKIKNKKYIKAKMGSVLILNANLWHGGSKKDTDGSRWALVLGYARWFIKPSFDYMYNTPASIYKKLSSIEKALLGFNLIPPRDEFTRLRRRSDFFLKSLILKNEAMKIGNRKISDQKPPFVVGEISGNHNGSLNNAIKMIKLAKKANLDAVKFSNLYGRYNNYEIEQKRIFYN